MKQFWSQLGAAARVGFVAGVLMILVLVAVLAWWALRPDYEPILRGASPDRLAESVRELERLKVPYRVSDDGSVLEVPREAAGRARVQLAGQGTGSSVGFELFNNSDFSTTEFTQKVNYQRALQGELARTLSTIDGVVSARVHLVLPESGFLRRQQVRPTAAVTLVLAPGHQLSAPQVAGIQKLVAAAVPEIKLSDISVLDHAGVSLTRARPADDDTETSRQLDIKREVDAYLEGKLRKLLAGFDDAGEFTVSVDATLNPNQVKVTTEDVLPADGGQADRGVMVRERVATKQDGGAAIAEAAASGTEGGGASSNSREIDYKVGHRVEQVATAPGNVDRISVAVIGRVRAWQSASGQLRDLVTHAIGADEERGDSVAIVLLPPQTEQIVSPPAPAPSTSATGGQQQNGARQGGAVASTAALHRAVLAGGALLALALLGVLVVLVRRAYPPAAGARALSPAEIDDVARKVQSWLAAEGELRGAP